MSQLDKLPNTGQLKSALTAVFRDVDQMTAECARIAVILDDIGIPALSDDGQPYQLHERVRQVVDLAELVLLSAVDTNRAEQMQSEVRRLRQENKVLRTEIGFMRQQEGKPT